MLPARTIFAVVIANLVLNGVLTQAEGEKACTRADERLMNEPIDELDFKQLLDILK